MGAGGGARGGEAPVGQGEVGDSAPPGGLPCYGLLTEPLAVGALDQVEEV